jgi:hypothetical protein
LNKFIQSNSDYGNEDYKSYINNDKTKGNNNNKLKMKQRIKRDKNKQNWESK